MTHEVKQETRTGANLRSGQPRIRHHRVREIAIYEVTDRELELLTNGAGASIRLSLAMFFLSNAFTSVASLATATFTNDFVRVAFIVMATSGFGMGFLLLYRWFRARQATHRVAQTIRDRYPED